MTKTVELFYDIGLVVLFRNAVLVYHNVFLVAAAKRFHLGKNAPGAADTIRTTYVE